MIHRALLAALAPVHSNAPFYRVPFIRPVWRTRATCSRFVLRCACALTLAALVGGLPGVARGDVQTRTEVRVPGRTISSSGEAVVYVVPDEAVVGFGIETFNNDLDKSKALNDAASVQLLKAVRALGIADKYIQTDTEQVDIRYRDGSHPTQGIEGYFCRRAYSVTLKDIKLLEKLTDTVLKNGANQLSGFEYRTTELRKHRDEARKMAIKACREKAEALAQELGCKVGPPRTINEVGYGYFGNSYRWGGNNYMMQNAVQAAPNGDDAGQATPLGQIGVRATISVTFDLIAPAGNEAKTTQETPSHPSIIRHRQTGAATEDSSQR